MQRSTLVILFALLLSGVVALAWLSRTPEPPARPGPESGHGELDQEGLLRPSMLRPKASVAGNDSMQPASEGQRAQLVANSGLESVTRIRMRVVEQPGGTPLAGVSVFARFLPTEYKQESGPDGARAAPSEIIPFIDYLDGGQLEQLVAGVAPLVSSAEGLVEVQAPVGGITIVVARMGSRWGREVLFKREAGTEFGTEELLLTRDFSVLVRTVDLQGKPIGNVPISLEGLERGHWRERWGKFTSEAEGEVRFEHCQLHFDTEVDSEAWRMAVGSLMLERSSQIFHVGDYSVDPIVLEVPRGGTVLVNALDVYGKPNRSGGNIGMGLVEDGQGRQTSAFDWDPRRMLVRELKAGAVRFEHVALGMDLDITLDVWGSNGSSRVFVSGPRTLGEEISVVLAHGGDHVVLGLRLLGPGGEPFRDADLEVFLKESNFKIGSTASVPLRSDSLGRLLVDLPVGSNISSILIAAGQELSCQIELDPTPKNGLVDLGEHRLQVTPTIASGRVLGPLGEAIEDARIALSLQDDSGDWRRRHSIRTWTNSEGEFELRGHLAADRIRLRPSHGEMFASSKEFSMGSMGIVLPMEQGGALLGQVLFDTSIPVDELEIRVSALGKASPSLGWRTEHVYLKDDGSFRCSPLPPGAYNVRLELSGNETVHEEAGVLIQAAPNTGPVVLPTIDMRGKLWALHITMEHDRDEPLAEAQVSYGESGSVSLGNDYYIDETDEIRLVTSYPRLDLDLLVPGYRDQSLRGVSGKRTLKLEPALRVRVQLIGDGEPLVAPFGLGIGLVPVGGSEEGMEWGNTYFDERRELLVNAPAAGPVRVVWIVEASSGTSGFGAYFDAEPEQIIHLVESTGEQSVSVRFSREEAQRLQREAME